MINCIFIVAIILSCTGPLQDLEVHYSPLVFPAQMPPAAQMISDALGEEDAWRAGIDAFLNNSTNLTNQTGLIAA